MSLTTIITRPGIRHDAARQLHELAELRSSYRTATMPRRPRLARLIAEHEARLAALDAAEDDLPELLLLARDEVRDD